MSTSAPDLSLASKAYQVISSPFRLLHSIIPRVSYEITVATSSGSRLLYLRTEIGSPIGRETNVSTSPIIVKASGSFSQFKKLPPELRSKIWEYALSESRIFLPVDEAVPGWRPVNFTHKPPAVRQTCREARRVSEWLGAIGFGQNRTAMKGLWFNFQSDILYLNTRYLLENAEELFPAINARVRNVALDWDALYVEEYDTDEVWERVLRDVIYDFPRCNRIILVQTTGDLPAGDITFFPIQDNEDWEINDCNCWGDAQTFIDLKWRSSKLLRELRITEEWLPSIEAVEAVPVRRKHVCWCKVYDII
ncbi:hypothetical protein FDECE_18512 [Fusarium decemcellulare]|nr:hypothetical protein FDECE_18512 [Fusarium decemcellulare]